VENGESKELIGLVFAEGLVSGGDFEVCPPMVERMKEIPWTYFIRALIQEGKAPMI
jgi:hypothetical protein